MRVYICVLLTWAWGPQVRTAAGNAVVGVSKLVKTQDLGHAVLTILLQLAHDDEVEEQRMTAVRFMRK